MDQEKIIEYQMLEQQIQNMSQSMNNIDRSIQDLKDLIGSLDEFKTLKKGDKVLVSVTNGIFVEAKLENPSNLIVNVGSNVTVKKNVEDSKKMIESQMIELETFRDESLENYEALYTRLTLLQQELMSSQNKE